MLALAVLSAAYLVVAAAMVAGAMAMMRRDGGR
jgi:hypothetical protein